MHLKIEFSIKICIFFHTWPATAILLQSHIIYSMKIIERDWYSDPHERSQA